MRSPTVSIIVPTYNYGHYLVDALASVRAQTYHDWEVVVVDDGSTDDTSRVIQPFLADPRVRYHLTENRGPSSARNTGISLARGRYIAFLDADDVWFPDKLAKQMPIFLSGTNIGVVYSRACVIDPAGQRITFKWPYSQPHRGNVLSALLLDNFVCFSSSVVDRTAFDVVGLFDETLPFTVDYELWLRVARYFNFEFVDDDLVQYRTGHANISRRSEERLQLNLRIIQQLVDDSSSREIVASEIADEALARIYCSLARMQRDRRAKAAFANYGRALRHGLFRHETWKGIAAAAIPVAARRFLKRALGRPEDWKYVPRVAEEVPNVQC